MHLFSVSSALGEVVDIPKTLQHVRRKRFDDGLDRLSQTQLTITAWNDKLNVPDEVHARVLAAEHRIVLKSERGSDGDDNTVVKYRQGVLVKIFASHRDTDEIVRA